MYKTTKELNDDLKTQFESPKTKVGMIFTDEFVNKFTVSYFYHLLRSGVKNAHMSRQKLKMCSVNGFFAHNFII